MERITPLATTALRHEVDLRLLDEVLAPLVTDDALYFVDVATTWLCHGLLELGIRPLAAHSRRLHLCGAPRVRLATALGEQRLPFVGFAKQVRDLLGLTSAKHVVAHDHLGVRPLHAAVGALDIFRNQTSISK